MELMKGASLLSRPAEEFTNDSSVEELWAVEAIKHAEVYSNLLVSVPPSYLRLTPYEDEIYRVFRQDFPDLRVDVLTDDDLKSPKAKIAWRQYARKFDQLENYSYGTLMRAESSKQFTPDNAILVVRIQFWAIESARNREGFNDVIYKRFRPPLKIQSEKPISKLR